MYIRDMIFSVARPRWELRGFKRVTLDPGERTTVSFELGEKELGFWNREGRFVVEPGDFKVAVWNGFSPDALARNSATWVAPSGGGTEGGRGRGPAGRAGYDILVASPDGKARKMIRTDFTQGNQFVIDVPIEWISTSRYQRSIYCMLKKTEPVSELHVVADEKVLGTNRHVIGEEHAPIAAPAETHASNLHDDREAWRHVKRLIENWYEPSEVPPVTKEQERGLAPDNLVVASGVVSALESFLAEKDPKYDKVLIRRTLKLVTQNPTQDGVRNALKPLFLKKKEERVPVARLNKSMAELVALVKRQGEIGEKMMEKEEEVKSLVVEQASQLKRHVTRRVGQLKKPNSRKPGPTMSEERRDDMRRVHTHVKEGYSVSKACDMVEAENRERGASVAHYASAAAMRDAYGRWKPAK